MIAAQVADLLHARRTGRRRWQARCPAHDDRTPSLSIAEGRDGRVLIRCRVGCVTDAVLKAAGLRMADLFSGPPPSLEQQAALARDREARDAAHRHLRQIHHGGCDRLLTLQRLVDGLAPRLVRMPDGAEADALAAQLHEGFDEIQRLESILMRTEAAWL